MTLTEQQIADGWKLHDGGPKPEGLPAVYDVITRRPREPYYTGYRWKWRDRESASCDVIAYREVQP